MVHDQSSEVNAKASAGPFSTELPAAFPPAESYSELIGIQQVYLGTQSLAASSSSSNCFS